ncbi:MAG: beta-ketoacyl reductase, partial [Pleurocapsa sp.]
HYRSSLGQPTWSINWGPWAGENMADAEFKTKLSRLGITPLTSETAIQALETLLSSNSIQTTVAQVDWHRFQTFYQSRRPRLLFEQIAPITNIKTTSPASASGSMLERLQQLPSKEVSNQLKIYLQTTLAKILKLKSTSMSFQQGFFELGMDSLMAVELKSCLERDFANVFPVSLIFNYSNIDKLTKYLEDFFHTTIQANNPQESTVIESKVLRLEKTEPASTSSIEPQKIEQLLLQEIQEIETLLKL